MASFVKMAAPADCAADPGSADRLNDSPGHYKHLSPS
jgi:hypothetical protein